MILGDDESTCQGTECAACSAAMQTSRRITDNRTSANVIMDALSLMFMVHILLAAMSKLTSTLVSIPSIKCTEKWEGRVAFYTLFRVRISLSIESRVSNFVDVRTSHTRL